MLKTRTVVTSAPGNRHLAPSLSLLSLVSISLSLSKRKTPRLSRRTTKNLPPTPALGKKKKRQQVMGAREGVQDDAAAGLFSLLRADSKKRGAVFFFWPGVVDFAGRAMQFRPLRTQRALWFLGGGVSKLCRGRNASCCCFHLSLISQVSRSSTVDPRLSAAMAVACRAPTVTQGPYRSLATT